MAAQPAPEPADALIVPGHAWDWLQRSRPVVERLADVLTGRPPKPGFVQAVRRSFADDPLVRDAVYAVIAEVAFRGRVPSHRPPGASWDRGLVWWAATLTGRSPWEYTEEPVAVDQPALFADVTDGGAPSERRALIAALHQLLAQSSGDQVPASAVRQLIAHLEQEPTRTDVHR